MIQKSYTTVVEIKPNESSSETVATIEQMLAIFFDELTTQSLIFDFIIIPPEPKNRFGFIKSEERYPQLSLQLNDLIKDRPYFIERIEQKRGLVVGISFKRQSFISLFKENGWVLDSLPQLEAKALLNHFFDDDVLALASRLKAGNLFFIPKKSASIYLINGANLNGIIGI